MCLNDSLPFINLSSNDFHEQIGISFHNIKANIADSCRQRLNLNPYQYLDDKFCDSNDIDADKNFYNIDLNNFNDYFDYVQMNNTLPPCSSSVQSMLHINAGSLVAHIDSLNIHLDTLKHKFSIKGVTETWTNNTNESSINIPGYEMWIKSRLDSKGNPALGGGVALYFDSNLNLDIKARPDLSCDNSNEMECLFAQVSQKQSKSRLSKVKDSVVGVIYRPPNTPINRFCDTFFPILEKISTENRPCYIMGDFNINLLNDTKDGTHVFMNKLFLNGFYPHIDRPTRVTERSATLIDNIFTNVYDADMTSGVWIADIADHLPIYVTLPPGINTAPCSGNNHRFISKRLYTSEKMENFKNQINECDWDQILADGNTNDKYSKFIVKITELHDENFPLRNFKINVKRETRPWLTNAILNSIKKKNNMYKNYLKNKSKLNEVKSKSLLDKYKKYKNKLQPIIRFTEKKYFADKILGLQNNMSKTWKV